MKKTTKLAASLAFAASMSLTATSAQAFGEYFQGFDDNGNGEGAMYPRTEQGYYTSHYELNNSNTSWLKTTSWTGSHIEITSDSQNVVSGRGWETGKEWRTVNYSINNYDPDWSGQHHTFALYGWTKSNNSNYDGIAEYYIVENHDGWNPLHQNDWNDDTNQARRPEGAHWLGSKTVNGSTYQYYVSDRTQRPHAYGPGNTTFKQYWAIRDNNSNSGAISVGEHFEMWKNPQEYKHEAYPYIGNWGYQIFSIELFNAGGKVDLNAWSTD